MFLHLD